MATIDLELIFEDEFMLVVDKPAGIPVIPERNPAMNSLYELLKEEYPSIFIVHRIDKYTSGLVCFAKTEEAHRHLCQQFENRTVRKFYLAIVQGRLKEKQGEFNQSIAENTVKTGTMLVHQRGKEALTLYSVAEQFNHFSLVDIEIKTGRTHQVRVHFAYAGNPIVADALYGSSGEFFFSSIKKKYKSSDQPERPTIARQCLHAAKLIIQHPETGKEMVFEAPIPKDMEVVLKLLRKYDK